MTKAAPVLALILSAFALSACSISVDENGYERHMAYKESSNGIEMGETRITIEQPAPTRGAAAAEMDRMMQSLRDRQCVIVSAHSWRRLRTESGPDLYGLRLSASCPIMRRFFKITGIM